LICLFIFVPFLDKWRLACGEKINGAKGKVDLQKVKEIISQYPSLLNQALNVNGDTPLMTASYNNYVSMVEFLLLCDGIEVNKRNRVL
jgi:hypothetical protein